MLAVQLTKLNNRQQTKLNRMAETEMTTTMAGPNSIAETEKCNNLLMGRAKLNSRDQRLPRQLDSLPLYRELLRGMLAVQLEFHLYPS